MKRGRSRKLYSAQKKSRYKNVDTWLDSVYKYNKEEIDAGLYESKDSEMTKKESFKSLVREYHDEGKSWTESLLTYEKSEHFTTTKERIQANLIKGLKGKKEAYEEFREYSKIKGKYTRIDADKLEWDATEKRYTYDAREWDEKSHRYIGEVISISFGYPKNDIVVETIDPGEID